MADMLLFDRGRLEIDLVRRAAVKDGNPLELTPTEFDLLAVLAGSPGRVFPRRQLIDMVLGYDFEGFEDTIYAHIKNLRKKVEDDPAKPRLIQTVYGVGYRFEGSGKGEKG
jgi:DNA-binding response OmpR family regulator